MMRVYQVETDFPIFLRDNPQKFKNFLAKKLRFIVLLYFDHKVTKNEIYAVLALECQILSLLQFFSLKL